MRELKHYVAGKGLTPLACALGMSIQRVSNWISRGNVPVEHCAALEQATDGYVRRWHLRPDDWHVIWPEIRRFKGAPIVKSQRGAP